MKKILNIISSQGGENSSSIKLANEILKKLQETYPGSTVHTNDLNQNPYPHLEESHITSFFTPEEYRSEAHNLAIRNSDEAINEILDADIIVISLPMYNFGIPSNLKAWIDHVIRQGKTFYYTEQGIPTGMIQNKKAYLSIASGSVYTEGHMTAYDFTEPYLRAILGFVGITDITAFRAEGTGIPGLKETLYQKAIESINNTSF